MSNRTAAAAATDLTARALSRLNILRHNAACSRGLHDHLRGKNLQARANRLARAIIEGRFGL